MPQRVRGTYSEHISKMIQQKEFDLMAKPRGFHLITDEVISHLQPLPEAGLLHLFVQHTSCALSICENWDPSVRSDMEHIYNHLIPEGLPFIAHTYEGEDDMPAHAKTLVTGVSLTIPITKGKLNLGTWQGIYLCEFRNHGGCRHVVATVVV